MRARARASPTQVRVFLLSLKAGAAGLTLTAACRVVLLEPALDPAVEQQAVARVHRIGQVRACVCVCGGCFLAGTKLNQSKGCQHAAGGSRCLRPLP